MKDELIIQCHDLIVQYSKITDDTPKKEKIRNELFLILKPYIAKWIASILAPKNAFLAPDEILSISWDCFLYCLSRYKTSKNISVPTHFYTYIKFFLIEEYKKKMEKQEKEKVDFPHSYSDPSLAFMHVDELKSFHEKLPSPYKIVFEDAIMSMSQGNQNKQRRLKESELNYVQYHESKKIFKIVVDFLVGR